MLLNAKFVAVKGLIALIPVDHGCPISPLGLSRELRFDLIPGREGTIVQSPDYSLDWPQSGRCYLLPYPAWWTHMPGTQLVTVAMSSLLLNEKLVQKLLSSERSHCGHPGLWMGWGLETADIHTPQSHLTMRSGCTWYIWLLWLPKSTNTQTTNK